MTPTDYPTLGANLARETTRIQGMTAQVILRGAVSAADRAYTAAIQAAVLSGDWAAVQAAGTVSKRCHKALQGGGE